MGTGWQSSARYQIYQRRLDRAVDQLPTLECHCLCLLWRALPPHMIARIIGVSEREVSAALERAVSQIVDAVS